MKNAHLAMVAALILAVCAFSGCTNNNTDYPRWDFNFDHLFDGLEYVVLLIFLGVWLILSTPFAIWTYFNAKKKGMEKISWLLFVLFTGVFGFIGYLFASRNYPIKTNSISQIENQIETTKEIAKCPECGAELEIEIENPAPESEPFKCPKCGADLKLT
jgi:predicted RNA-binding Zn-ribbon protein involved in translation (DUF1610 family)